MLDTRHKTAHILGQTNAEPPSPFPTVWVARGAPIHVLFCLLASPPLSSINFE